MLVLFQDIPAISIDLICDQLSYLKDLSTWDESSKYMEGNTQTEKGQQ